MQSAMRSTAIRDGYEDRMLCGFGKHDKRTWYTRRPFARRDFIALAVGVVLLLISLTVTIRFGRFYNPFV